MARRPLPLSGHGLWVAISKVPYLTPEDVPEGRDCRALLIPASTDWLAIFSGALTELSKEWNWEQQGITVDEALVVVAEVINGYYDGCVNSGCTLPGGGGIFRLNENWQIEQLVDGEWVPPQGDYELPPTPAREEPTEQDRICLAAANAVNALAILYEQLSDSYALGQETSVAMAAFVTAVAGGIGAAFGLVVAPLLALYAIIFTEVYLTVEFLTADLWTEEFTEKLICYFVECASEPTEDVVHFDIPCIVGKIAETTDFDWTFSEVRLLLQVGGILNMIGSQAVDQAGGATAIETADCTCGACEIVLEETCGYGTVENIGGNRWRITALFVDTNYAVCVAAVGEECWGYTDIDFVSGVPDYQDFLDCASASHVGQPGGCTGDPDTGQPTDIKTWFLASSTASFVVELTAHCHEDCA